MKQNIYKLLRWSERYTKTDMVYLARGSFWLYLDQGVLFLLSFATLWFFANLLNPEVYGQYRFLITVISLLSITSLPGMRTALIRAVAKGNSGIIPQLVATRITWGLIGSAGSLIGALYYFVQNNPEMGWLFVIIAIFVPFYESLAIVNNYHNGRKDYPNFALTSIVRYALITLATITAIILSENIFIIFGTHLLSTALVNSLIYHYTAKHFPFSGKIDTETIPYGKKLSLMSAIGTASGHLDKIALWYLSGPVQVAAYTITIALPREMAGAFSQIGTLALPKMANRTKTEMQQSLLRKMFIFFIASIFITFAYIFLAPIIFDLLLPQYLEYVFISQVAATLIIFTPVTLLVQYFQATMHTRALYVMQFVLPVILITLFFLLIPPFGALGAVIATLGRQLASLFLLLYYFLTDDTITHAKS